MAPSQQQTTTWANADFWHRDRFIFENEAYHWKYKRSNAYWTYGYHNFI